MKKLIVSKEDLENNIKIINKMKKEDCQIIGVVKANGMGLDLVQYSKLLIKNDIKFLAVSDPDDALELRKNGIKTRILLLTPVYDELLLEQLISKSITLTIATTKQAEMIGKISKKLKRIASVHVKIDTGFGRYGFLYNNKKGILKVFENQNDYKVRGVYTHFSKSIDKKITKKQFEKFKRVLGLIKKEGFKPGIKHCSNSTAFIQYSDMHLDAVRLGSIIQGRTLINVKGLKKIGTFECSIAQIKTLPKGYTIGYGNTYKLKKETKVAIIPVGHADGFEIRNKRDNFSFVENIKSVCIEIRKMFKPENAVCYINKKEYKVIGRIGLNYAIIDITDSTNIGNKSKVVLNINPLNVNNKIRREYV